MCRSTELIPLAATRRQTFPTIVAGRSTHRYGVCKYYIGPIGDLSLSTATAAGAARVHSLR